MTGRRYEARVLLLHRSTVIKISGDSYRMMEKKKAGMKPAEEEAKKAPKG
ncbi:MAG: hypothetical protein IPM63_04795 [Acidobacteriota bacterium]|nr:MAG: hypothetical protein IPM63_04795 [Acidobacteriota bacterium]